MPIGVMAAERSPASRVLPGEFGTIAAKSKSSGPTQVIIGWIGWWAGRGLMCQMSPMAKEVTTR